MIELVILETIDHDILNAPETGWRCMILCYQFVFPQRKFQYFTKVAILLYSPVTTSTFC